MTKHHPYLKTRFLYLFFLSIGVLMTVSWVLMCGMAIAISRYFKDFLPDVKVAGTKVWFQVDTLINIALQLLFTEVQKVLSLI